MKITVFARKECGKDGGSFRKEEAYDEGKVAKEGGELIGSFQKEYAEVSATIGKHR